MNNWKTWGTLVTGAGLLWLFLGIGSISAPQLTGPGNALQLRGHVPVTGVTLQWTHGGRRISRPRPRPAGYFVICVDDRAHPDEQCGSGAARNFVMDWTVPDSLERTALSDDFGNLMDRPYSYRYTVELPVRSLGRQLYWTVGACTRQDDLQSCTFSDPPRTLMVNATDLHAVRVEGSVISSSLTIDTVLENTGEMPVEADDYYLATSVLEILADPAHCDQPLRNVNRLNNPDTAVDEAADFQVLTRDGEITTVYRLPLNLAGGRDIDNVYAVLRKGTGRIVRHWAYHPSVDSDSADNAIKPRLVPGKPVTVKPCPAVQREGGRSGRCVIRVPADGHFEPRAFAVVTTIDPLDSITEFDESNNSSMRADIRLYSAGDSGCRVQLYGDQ